jgi:hypothetical protein
MELRVDPLFEHCRSVLPMESLTGSPPFKVASRNNIKNAPPVQQYSVENTPYFRG